MIPIGLPSLEFVLIRLAFGLTTLVWLAWTLQLCLSARARQRLGPGMTALYAASAVLGLYTVTGVYQLQRHIAQTRAAHDARFRLTLTEAQSVGGIQMPAGTTLELAVAHEADAFSRARFPHPVLIGGVAALTAERYLSIQTNDAYQTTGYVPENIRLTGRGPSVLLGWICDSTHAITLQTHPDGRVRGFSSCTLASGNQVEHAPLPAGAEIVATTGSVYLDGRVDVDRWLIHLPEHGELRIGGSVQKGGAILLDADRKLYRRVP